MYIVYLFFFLFGIIFFSKEILFGRLSQDFVSRISSKYCTALEKKKFFSTFLPDKSPRGIKNK